MDQRQPGDGESEPEPNDSAPAWSRLFWPIVLAAAALTIILSVGVGRVIGAALLERSMGQVQLMPTAVPTAAIGLASSQRALLKPGEGKELFSSPSPSPTASAQTPAANIAPVILYEATPTPAPTTAPPSAQPAPGVRVTVTHAPSAPTPPPTPRPPTPVPTPRPTFAPIIQITPVPIMPGGG